MALIFRVAAGFQSISAGSVCSYVQLDLADRSRQLSITLVAQQLTRLLRVLDECPSYSRRVASFADQAVQGRRLEIRSIVATNNAYIELALINAPSEYETFRLNGHFARKISQATRVGQVAPNT